MAETKTLNVYETPVESGRYKLLVKSTETYWSGEDSGKMEDMPGTFLETQISLLDISKPLSKLEALAVEMKVILHKGKREITDEPKGYAKLWHNHIVQKAEKDLTKYIQNIATLVKDKL